MARTRTVVAGARVCIGAGAAFFPRAFAAVGAGHEVLAGDLAGLAGL